MTRATGEHAHLSIGEVLSLLQEEFPDVTISKIRFLESQGLLDPERTPSGYRKFYEADIERLRWILTQQKENFLPLKVIKDRLDEVESGAPSDDIVDPSAAAGQDAAGPGPGSADEAVAAATAGGEQPVPIWMADAARVAAARSAPELPLGEDDGVGSAAAAGASAGGAAAAGAGP